MTERINPILVVSYLDETRAALAKTLESNNIESASCATFCEAENLALAKLYGGMLVDLPSIIKSKGEEKIVAYTLANFFPTLRVRTMGGMLVPMAMPGSAKQDKSLGDFLTKTCPAFTPRMLRTYRRHSVCLPTLITFNDVELRGFTLDISWGGMFVVDLQPEKFCIGDLIAVTLPEFDCTVSAEVRNTKPWGLRRQAPGIGIHFNRLDETLEPIIAGITRTSKEFDRDRLTT